MNYDTNTKELTILAILKNHIEGLYATEIVDQSCGTLAVGDIFDHLKAMK